MRNCKQHLLCTILLRLFILLGMGLITSHAFPQTYIGPTIGYDFMTVQGEHWDFGGDFSGDEFRSTTYGFNAEYVLSKQFNLSFQGEYTKKTFGSETKYICGVGLESRPDHKVWDEFKLYRFGLSLKWFPLEHWYIGGGPTAAYRTKVELSRYAFDSRETTRTYSPGRTEYGASISSGCRWENVLFEIRYHRGLIRPENGAAASDRLKPMQSLAFSATYLFRISNL